MGFGIPDPHRSSRGRQGVVRRRARSGRGPAVRHGGSDRGRFVPPLQPFGVGGGRRWGCGNERGWGGTGGVRRWVWGAETPLWRSGFGGGEENGEGDGEKWERERKERGGGRKRRGREEEKTEGKKGGEEKLGKRKTERKLGKKREKNKNKIKGKKKPEKIEENN